MKLIRFGNPGKEKPGIISADGQWIDTSEFGEDYNGEFFANEGVTRLSNWIENHKKNLNIISKKTRLGSPLKDPSKIVCIGLNYVDHAIEAKLSIPEQPILFFKATSAIGGPNDEVIIPRSSQKTDWEVELAVIIGKKASYVAEEKAMEYVVGYAIHNDYSERAFQLEMGGQWVKGKSCDTFAPIGPYLATKEEIADVDNLNLWLKVNNEIKQNSNTSQLIFKIPKLVSYISQFMSLLPGDIISTGTPPGVGLGFEPPQYLKPGDIVELGIDGLGKQKQILVSAK